MPAPINASVSRPIINLLLIEKSMILLIIDKGVNSVEILVLHIELNAMHNVDEFNEKCVEVSASEMQILQLKAPLVPHGCNIYVEAEIHDHAWDKWEKDQSVVVREFKNKMISHAIRL